MSRLCERLPILMVLSVVLKYNTTNSLNFVKKPCFTFISLSLYLYSLSFSSLVLKVYRLYKSCNVLHDSLMSSWFVKYSINLSSSIVRPSLRTTRHKLSNGKDSTVINRFFLVFFILNL